MVSHAPRSLTLVNKRRRHNDRTSMHDFSFVASPHIKETINATRASDFAILPSVYAISVWCFEVRPLCWRTSHGENCRRASHIDVFESCVYCFRRGLPFQDKESFSKLATETTPKQEIWLLGQISAVPLLVWWRSYFKSLRNRFWTLPTKTWQKQGRDSVGSDCIIIV